MEAFEHLIETLDLAVEEAECLTIPLENGLTPWSDEKGTEIVGRLKSLIAQAKEEAWSLFIRGEAVHACDD